MKLFVNALSTTNESGRQVLCGLLAEWLRQTPDANTLVLLLHPGNQDIAGSLRSDLHAAQFARVTVCMANKICGHWLGRTCYEHVFMRRWVLRSGAAGYLSPSGGWIRGIPSRQYTLALNPWAMVATGPRGIAGQIKAFLQRRAYRLAQQHADGIGYGSMHMRDLYRQNAGGQTEKRGAIVYPALPCDAIEVMDALWQSARERDPLQILCVSHMAPHKDVETLLLALQQVREAHGIPATLRVVGRWSDLRYRSKVEGLIGQLSLKDVVTLDGFLTRAELLEAYRRAKVYCLLSRSESFGIPSVEAQRLGTPVVAAYGSAASEVCGEGGVYVEPGDAQEAATQLARLLTDAAYWQHMSAAARENAMRFEYAKTVQPLLQILAPLWQ